MKEEKIVYCNCQFAREDNQPHDTDCPAFSPSPIKPWEEEVYQEFCKFWPSLFKVRDDWSNNCEKIADWWIEKVEQAEKRGREEVFTAALKVVDDSRTESERFGIGEIEQRARSQIHADLLIWKDRNLSASLEANQESGETACEQGKCRYCLHCGADKPVKE